MPVDLSGLTEALEDGSADESAARVVLAEIRSDVVEHVDLGLRLRRPRTG
jgi:hypothetical protein